MNVCTHKAITMRPDACGFLFPTINQDICVDCGLCKSTCPVNNTITLEKPHKCYAATVTDEQELLSCSSGGVATAISKLIISKGGVVYGCSAKNPRYIQHIRVNKMGDLELLKGSKYVQSYLGNIFQDIKIDLCEERYVLFVGTPCQVSGLKGFLHKGYPNLLTIDLVCHGVPSQKMLNDNLKYYCSDDEDVSVTFRRKNEKHNYSRIEFGWELKSGNGASYTFKPYNKDFYMFGFLRCLTFRENCYSCPYAQNRRIGDLTLCDFWGLQADAGFENGKGVSAVLVNTSKGGELFEEVKDNLVWKQREVSEATRWNDQLNYPSKKPKNYHRFIQLYSKVAYKESMIKAFFGAYIYDYYILNKNRLISFILKHHILKD
jgi:coenzyme F420-reducing hydrogenase beta subunit